MRKPQSSLVTKNEVWDKYYMNSGTRDESILQVHVLMKSNKLIKPNN